MRQILCVYCTRTGHTKDLMERIAAELGADTALITDGVSREGVLGYAGAAIAGLRKEPPEILSVNTARPMQEYGQVLVGAPIWSERVCPLAKSFLRRYRRLLQGDVSYVITHMSPMLYEKQIAALDAWLGKPHRAHLSLSTGTEADHEAEIREFLELIE